MLDAHARLPFAIVHPNLSAQPHALYGLIGHPLRFSLSPAIHRAAFEACGLSAEYELLPVKSGELPSLLDRIRSGEIAGANVTVPHKRAAAEQADALSTLAEELGAVNTLLRGPDGRLHGDNTDVAGFQAQLAEMDLQDGRHREALVMGAGGAARAVALTLLDARWQVRVIARSSAQSGLLAAALYRVRPGARISTGPWRAEQGAGTEPDDATAAAELLVNATPLGSGGPGDEGGEGPWPSTLPFPPSLRSVIDLVAWPVQTRIVTLAQASGLRAAGGLTMLIAQAGESFRLWTGLEPPLARMRAAALAEIALRAGEPAAVSDD